MTDGSITIGTSVDVGGINTGLKSINKSMKKLTSFAVLALGVKALAKLGVAAVSAASDLQEVQNIVDTAFGKDLVYKMEKFSETCIESFGMSELAAKQTGGSFMAMGKAVGLSGEQASDMAITLTGLSGDMASFLNISQEYAKVALSAVYTGETETLKRYGIILTEANLQQYAYTQGINQSVKSMDAATKVQLRYDYIMKVTGKDMMGIQGDFAKTAGSWANQIRLLTENWKQLIIVLGKGLIAVLTPIVKLLNMAIQALTVFANFVGSVLTKIFGIDWDALNAATSGTGSNAEEGAEGLDDLGDAATNAAKDAKKALAPFDDLNVLIDDTANAASGAASGLGGIGGGLDLGGEDAGSLFKDLLPDIDTLYELGEWIGEQLIKAMNSIPWDKVYAAAKNFGKGLAEFLNGLISPELFYTLGKTIANALNTVVYAALAFIEEFDWADFGKSLAAGINGLFLNFDWKSTARALAKWFNGLYTTMKEMALNIKWGEIATAIAEGINTFFDEWKPAEFAKALNAWVDGLKEFIVTLIKKVDWQDVWDKIGEFLGELEPDTIGIMLGALTILGIKNLLLGFDFGKFLSTTLSTALGTGNLSLSLPGLISKLTTTLTPFSVALSDTATFTLSLGGALTIVGASLAVFAAIMVDLYKTSEDVRNAFSEMSATLKKVIGSSIEKLSKSVSDLVDSLKELGSSLYNLYEKTLKPIFEALTPILIKLNTLMLSSLIEGITSKLSGIITEMSGAATVISGVADAISSLMELDYEGFVEGLKTISDGFGEFLKGLGEFFGMSKGAGGKVNAAFKQLVTDVSTSVSAIWTNIVMVFSQIGTWIYTNVISPVVGFFVGFATRVGQIFEGLWILITAVWITVSEWFNTNVITPIIDFFSPIVETVGGFFSDLWLDIQNVWGAVSSWFSSTIIEPLKESWKNATDDIAGFFTKLWSGITSGVKGAMNTVISSVESVINFMANGINDILGGFNKVVSWAAKIAETDWGGVDLIPNVSLPRLASGAVIPPNKEFMAILGDQKSGTNIETPLSTMIDAFKTAMSSMNIGNSNSNATMTLDGETFARLEVPYVLQELKRQGYNVTVLEG